MMRGFKAFNNDLTCRGFQYEVGQVYEMDETPVCCKTGFHFCKNLADVYKFYDMSDDTRICVVEALGELVTDDKIKYCTNKIKIVEEITDRAIKHCNVNDTSTGYCNTGDCNTGNYNTGYCNTGYRNTGYCNTGNCNTGDCNTGNYNTGNRNTGSRNTGNRNTGNCNTGYCNTGNYNTGYCNTGDYNTGDYNTGNRNTGYCNTINAKVRLFNHYTDFEFNSREIVRFREILNSIPVSCKYTQFIDDYDMTEKEKAEHPEYVTIGGYLKVVEEKADVKKWWDKLSEKDKEFIKSLPHYDEKVFFECIGLKEE